MIAFRTAVAVGSEEPLSPGYDTATKGDAEFNKHFRHGFTTIDDVQMHYVIGGDGPQVLVLLTAGRRAGTSTARSCPRYCPAAPSSPSTCRAWATRPETRPP
ncbi:hypothetical protein ACF05L_07785 [Streptomyces bobili]|uniref:hypothetical protein n=1 Tax=Streptomyces bobili TaxID=67280 RepID=UPI0036F5333A